MLSPSLSRPTRQRGPTMKRDPAPYPVPLQYIRDLCEAATDPDAANSKGQRAAARMLKMSERTVRYWCSLEDNKVCPWAAAELLRRLLIEQHGGRTEGLPDPAHYPPDRGARTDVPGTGL